MNVSIGLTASDVRRIVWTAVFAFVGVYATLATGTGELHSYSQAKAAVIALFPAAVAAALSAVKNGILSDASAVK